MSMLSSFDSIMKVTEKPIEGEENSFKCSLGGAFWTEWRDEDNNIHRDDGPARIFDSGYIEWWWHGDHFNTFDRWQKASGANDEIYVISKLKYTITENDNN